MSILIKGMEMPTTHPLTVTIYPDGQVLSETVGAKNIHGEAVPVPSHGDLIDRKPFVEFIKTHWDSYDQWFVDQLEARPTVIPAEEGET